MVNNYTKEVVINVFCDSRKIKQAIKIAIIVGIILNIINQGGYIFHLSFDKINFFKLFMTFCVPFLVSTYTAVSISLDLKIDDKAMASTNLICKTCKSHSYVKKNEIIPECPRCGLSGKWKATK
jgi:hypothetical protein